MLTTAPSIDLNAEQLRDAEAFHQHCLLPHQPRRLAGLLQNWAALEKWSLGTLGKRTGKELLKVEHYPSGHRHDAFCYHRMTLDAYCQQIQSDPASRRHYYLAEVDLDTLSGAIHDDFARPHIIPSDAEVRTVLFAGIDTFSTAHYHRFARQALLAQAVGRKRVILWEPAARDALQFHRWFAVRSNHSRIPFDAIEEARWFDQHPELRDIPRWEVLLEPGQMLYIPDHWPHLAIGMGASVSVTFFWSAALRHADYRGVLRDAASETANRTYRFAAAATARCGLAPLAARCAASWGLINRSDVDAVTRQILSFGSKSPQQIA